MTSCPPGTSPSPLKNCVSCPGGYYCPNLASTPILCPAGFFCGGGAGYPIQCSPGFYCPAGSASAKPCQAVSTTLNLETNFWSAPVEVLPAGVRPYPWQGGGAVPVLPINNQYQPATNPVFAPPNPPPGQVFYPPW